MSENEYRAMMALGAAMERCCGYGPENAPIIPGDGPILSVIPGDDHIYAARYPNNGEAAGICWKLIRGLSEWERVVL